MLSRLYRKVKTFRSDLLTYYKQCIELILLIILSLSKKGNNDNNKNNRDKNDNPDEKEDGTRSSHVICPARRKMLLLWQARSQIT
jgi:hypothetical protein